MPARIDTKLAAPFTTNRNGDLSESEKHGPKESSLAVHELICNHYKDNGLGITWTLDALWPWA
jgi:hypothetical protein